MNLDHIRSMRLQPELVKSAVASPSLTVYEAHKGQHNKVAKRLVVGGGLLKNSNIDISWLPAAAETFCISSDPEDYVVADIPIVTSDVPNRNMQGFPREELTYFDPMKGRQVYKSFIGKSTFANHVNQNPVEAKGVIFDSSLEYVPAYDVWKVRILAGWDRTKDPYLVDQILSGKRTGFSMGAMVACFACSICGSPDTNVNPCRHMDMRLGNQKGALWDINRDRRVHPSDIGVAAFEQDGNVTAEALATADSIRLVFQQCCDVEFFECSSVDDPADPTADIKDSSKPIWIP